ncbi:MAG: hypothetical protein HZB14_03930 [Actinobacteria bacterium]|nr:hypothetical protein [Actinomycetota bacterium]
MRRTESHLCTRGSLALLVAVLGLAIAAGPAAAVVVSLKTFKTSIDVRLNITEHSIWHGIRPGCYAPHEDFDIRYHMSIDSKPTRKSDIKNGTASLTGGSYGVTPSYGDRRSFEQFSTPGQWTLETQYPAGCGTDPPGPVPDWATSPTCKSIKERVSASLLQNTLDDPNDPTSNLGSNDGVLVLTRTPRAKPTVNGSSVGDSCFRTLHSVDPIGVDSNVEIGPKDTYISVPIPNLHSKLSRLAKGSRKSRPSFRVPIKVSGDCKSMQMSPSNGLRDGFITSPFSQPHNALGSFNGEPDKSICTIAGSGVAIVRRESRVTETATVLR